MSRDEWQAERRTDTNPIRAKSTKFFMLFSLVKSPFSDLSFFKNKIFWLKNSLFSDIGTKKMLHKEIISLMEHYKNIKN